MSEEMKEYLADDSDLVRNAKAFEEFYLRPKKMANTEVVLRMRITKRWGGWRLKDELVESIGLEIGDTISTEVSVLCGPGLIDTTDNTDLFASGDGADWLLKNNIGYGSIIDAKVKFMFSKAPVGRDGKEVWKISLIFVEGYNIVRDRVANDENDQDDSSTTVEDMLKRLLKSN